MLCKTEKKIANKIPVIMGLIC